MPLKWISETIARLTLQAVKPELPSYSNNHRPRQCVEDVANIEEYLVNGAGLKGKEARLKCNGKLWKNGLVQASPDRKQVQAMLRSTPMTVGGEECVLGQVADPAVTEAGSNPQRLSTR